MLGGYWGKYNTRYSAPSLRTVPRLVCHSDEGEKNGINVAVNGNLSQKEGGIIDPKQDN